ncbi:MAG: two-component regulator propeller domain-containing protein [Chitinophagales bacterium]
MKHGWLSLLFTGITLSWAQVPLGTWISHGTFGVAIQAARADDRIITTTEHGIFNVDRNNRSISKIEKSQGLSDATISRSGYHAGKNALLIAYQSSNIDLLINQEINNIPDIKNKITGTSKNINEVTPIGDNFYLATDLGLVVFDIDKKEIRNTYVIGDSGANVRVFSVTADDTYFYAGTEHGLKMALRNGSNLQDFNSWQTIGPKRNCLLCRNLEGVIYAVERDSLFKRNGMSLDPVRADYNWAYKNLTVSEGNLYATQWFDTTGAMNGRVIKIDPSGNMTDLYFPGRIRPNQLITDGNVYWLSDQYSGLRRIENGNDESFIPNGPPSIGGFDLIANNDVVRVAMGSTDPQYIQLGYNFDGPVKRENAEWRSYPLGAYGTISGCYDLVDVDQTASGDIVYYGSLQCGLVEWHTATNEFINYDETNSIIEPCYPGNRKISALAVDQKGNLWMSNTCSSRGLKVKTPGGQWYQFSVPSDLITVRKMMIDSRGWVWMCGRGGRINVYDPGDDLASTDDDQYRSLSVGAGYGGLPNSNVFCMVEDKNNDVWVGTEEGIGTFYCPGSIFSTNGCDADRIKVERDGFIGYLFSTEIVRAMAVDGANRKWVGTTNGLWLISADGKTEIHRFTKDNSPIPNNSILSIAVDQKTGQVYIGTEGGMVSYWSDAILGESTAGKAIAFPNPVKSDYSGPIAIKGLVDDAYVKILDSGGTLVFQGKANGGLMIWDGKGYTGTRVATGVYTVLSSTDLGKERAVAKIIFSN